MRGLSGDPDATSGRLDPRMRWRELTVRLSHSRTPTVDGAPHTLAPSGYLVGEYPFAGLQEVNTLQFASSGNVTVAYELTGHGEPLLLLPGLAAPASLWPQRWLELLEGTFTVIAMSHRGTGQSSRVDGPFSTLDLADDAAGILDAVGLGPAHVFGHSMGGLVAQALAVRHPDQVRSLVLASTAAGMTSKPTEPRDGTPRLPSFQHFRTAIELWRSMAGPGFPESQPEVMRDLEACLIASPTPIVTILYQLQAISTHPPALAAQISQPALVMHGTADQVVPASSGRALARKVNDARFAEFADIGHLVPWEEPGDCADHLVALCKPPRR